MKQFLNLVFSIVFLIFSCTSTKVLKEEEVYGTYQWYSLPGITARIIIHPNSKFEYRWQQGLNEGVTYGNWILRGNLLILNSEQTEEPKTLIELPYLKNREEKYSIKVTDIENEPVIHAKCLLRQDTSIIEISYTDEHGFCQLVKNTEANNLKIDYIGLQPVYLSIDSLKTNSFSIKMKAIHEHYEFFRNRKWKIKGDRIYDPTIKTDRFTKKYYQKIE